MSSEKDLPSVGTVVRTPNGFEYLVTSHQYGSLWCVALIDREPVGNAAPLNPSVVTVVRDLFERPTDRCDR
jgi:hypothetical protein